MSETYDLDVVRDLLDDGSGAFDTWLRWLSNNGFAPIDEQLDETRIVALAAGIRFATAGRPRQKVRRFVDHLLVASPGPDVDWVAVDRPGTRDIEIKSGPFTMRVERARTRVPFVFDPQPLREALRERRNH